MHVYDGPVGSKPLGQLQQVYSPCGSEFDVVVGGKVQYRISGPCCVCDGPCCGDQQFFINTPTGGQIQTPVGVARITKMGARVRTLPAPAAPATPDAPLVCCRRRRASKAWSTK